MQQETGTQLPLRVCVGVVCDLGADLQICVCVHECACMCVHVCCGGEGGVPHCG
jgi:hypothetical protein